MTRTSDPENVTLRLGRRKFVGAAGLCIATPLWVEWLAGFFGPRGTIHDVGRVREATPQEIEAVVRRALEQTKGDFGPNAMLQRGVNCNHRAPEWAATWQVNVEPGDNGLTASTITISEDYTGPGVSSWHTGRPWVGHNWGPDIR